MGGFTPPSPGQAEDWEVGQTIAIMTLFGLVGAQWALEQFEAAVADHRHVLTLLRHTYRELMLVGLISLLLYVFEAALDAKNEDVLYSFESTHLLLLVAALCYLALAFALVGLSLLIARQWEALERRYAWDDAAQAALLAECAGLKAALRLDDILGTAAAATAARGSPSQKPPAAPDDGAPARRCAFRARRCALPWWLALAARVAAHPVLAYRFYRQLPALRFLQQRTRFIATHGLPPQFSFAVYLRKSKQQAFVALIEVPLSAWLILGFIVTLDLFVRSISPAYAGAATPPAVISAGSVIVIAASLAVYIKVNRAHWATLHGYYEGGRGGGGGGSFRDLTSLELTTAGEDSGGGDGGGAAPVTVAAAVATPAMPAPAGAGKDDDVAVTVATPPTTPPPAARPPLGRGGCGTRTLAQPPPPPLPPHRPEELFWFRSPLFLLRLLQGTVFASALMVALLARFWYVFAGYTEANPYAWEASPGATYAVAPILAAVSVACVLLLTRHVVPLYVIILHTGDDVDMGLLIEAVEKQRALERGRRRQAHARALHERFLAAYGPPTARQRVRSVMGGRLYTALISAAVVTDVFLVALLVSQWMQPEPEQRVFFAQVALTVLLFLDQAARVAVDRRRFFVGPHGAHNVFDLLVSTAALASSLAEVGLYYGPGASHDVSGGDAALRVSIITALRLLRLFVVIKLPGCGGGGGGGGGGGVTEGGPDGGAGCCGDDGAGGVVAGADAAAHHHHHHQRRLSAAGSIGAISRGSSFLSLYEGGAGGVVDGVGGAAATGTPLRGSLVLVSPGGGDDDSGADSGGGLPVDVDAGRAGIASIAAAHAAADAAALRAREGVESQRSVVDSGSYDTLRSYAPLWSLLHQLQLLDQQQHHHHEHATHRGSTRAGGASGTGASALPITLGSTPALAVSSVRRLVVSVPTPAAPVVDAPAGAVAAVTAGAVYGGDATAASEPVAPHHNMPPAAPDPDATASDPPGHVTLTLSSELAGALAAQLALLQREAEAGATTLRGLPPHWLAAAHAGTGHSGRHLTPSMGGGGSRPALRDIFVSGSGSSSAAASPASGAAARPAATFAAEAQQQPTAAAAAQPPLHATGRETPAATSDTDSGARTLPARIRVPDDGSSGGGGGNTGGTTSGATTGGSHHDPFADTIVRLRSAHKAAEKLRRREARARQLHAQAAASAGASPRTPPTPIEHSRSLWLPGADGHRHTHSLEGQRQHPPLQPSSSSSLQAAHAHGGSASMPHLADLAAPSSASAAVGSHGHNSGGVGGIASRSRQGSLVSPDLRDAVFEEEDEESSDSGASDNEGGGGGSVIDDAVQRRSRAGSLVQHHVVVAAPPSSHAHHPSSSNSSASIHQQPVSVAAPSHTAPHHAGGSTVARGADTPPSSHPDGAS